MIKLLKLAIFLLMVLLNNMLFAADFDTAAFISAHNTWRAEAEVKEKLSYSPELAASAQAWANKLKQNNQCKMRHSEPDGKYGENLYWASAMNWSDGRKEQQKITPEKVVNSWGSEKADYDYASNSCKAGTMCGHYPPAVRRGTPKVGRGMAVCTDTRNPVWVCQYQPAGNWVGKKPY